MLKLNELRIGNFFEIERSNQVKKKIKKVCAIRQKNVLLDDAWYNLDKLIPVKITAEILLKCGFVKFDWITESNIFHSNYFKGKLDENGFKIFDNNFTNLKPLKYLHELQNLHFDLTEKELEINLNEPISKAILEY
jgi:hypothetical protein